MVNYICFIALSIVFFIFILENKETSFRKYKYENILILSLIIFVWGGAISVFRSANMRISFYG